MNRRHQIARQPGSAIFPGLSGRIPPGGASRLSHNRAEWEMDV